MPKAYRQAAHGTLAGSTLTGQQFDSFASRLLDALERATGGTGVHFAASRYDQTFDVVMYLTSPTPEGAKVLFKRKVRQALKVATLGDATPAVRIQFNASNAVAAA
ncbi:hypothetical protein [Streptomyces sp. NPDC051636]|uniref:hypothetical protein n=1 Tax=Streptomyces sp. NPDC051636 TaxID=3365663 RepID=UPI00379E8051